MRLGCCGDGAAAAAQMAAGEPPPVFPRLYGAVGRFLPSGLQVRSVDASPCQVNGQSLAVLGDANTFVAQQSYDEYGVILFPDEVAYPGQGQAAFERARRTVVTPAPANKLLGARAGWPLYTGGGPVTRTHYHSDGSAEALIMACGGAPVAVPVSSPVQQVPSPPSQQPPTPLPTQQVTPLPPEDEPRVPPTGRPPPPQSPVVVQPPLHAYPGPLLPDWLPGPRVIPIVVGRLIRWGVLPP